MEIYKGDCLDIIPTLKDKNISLVLVDLPYGQTDCKWDKTIDLDEMWKVLKKVCTKECVFLFFCTSKFGVDLIMSRRNAFKYDLVWEKSNSVGFLCANKLPLRKHEMIYVFKNNGKTTYNPQKTKGKPYKSKTSGGMIECYGGSDRIPNPNESGDRHPTSILKFNSEHNTVHPTQKPVKLCEWLINSYSNPGDTVLDFTMGSGTTGIACKNTGRKFIGIEKDPDIFEIAKKRLE